MSICLSSCFPVSPGAVRFGCDPTPRKGGISHLLFASCDVLVDASDWSTFDWCNLWYSGKITISNKLIGKKVESAYIKRRLISCSAETVVGMTHRIEFEDLLVEGSNQENFWIDIVNNPLNYNFGYITCDGYFAGFFKPTAIELSEIIPETYNEFISYKGIIEWNDISVNKPIHVGNLVQALTQDCAGVPNFSLCNFTGSVGFFNNKTGGCKQGDVIMVAPFYRDVRYLWYINNVLKQDGLSNKFEPDQFGLPVKVVLSRLGCDPFEIIAPTPENLNTNIPTVSSVTVASDGSGYYRLTVFPTNQRANMRYRVINSAGYQTAWQVSPVFRGIIPGLTIIEISVLGFDCYTSYKLLLP